MKTFLYDLLRQLFENKMLNSMLDKLTINFASGWINSATKIMEQYLIPLGMTMVLIYFLMEIVDHLQFNPTTFEFLLKSFIKLFIGLFVVGNCIQLFIDLNGAAINLTREITLKLGSEITQSDGFKIQGMKDAIANANTLGCVGYYVWLLVAMIVVLIIQLAIDFILYSRVVKQYLLATFAPIGLSDIISGGFNSKGFRYIKQYLALCLQGLVIAVTVSASNVVIAFINKQMDIEPGFTITFLISFLLSQLVVAGAIQRSEQISKEIIGV